MKTSLTKRLAWGGTIALLAIGILTFASSGYAWNSLLGDSGTDAAKVLNPCAAKNLTDVAAGNPCNPCGHKNACNPCNPCAKKNACNPCGHKNPCNPCGHKNPCNPCGGKNPCNPCNPCGGAKIDSSKFLQPAGVKLAGGDHAALVKQGEKLWNDRTLGSSGLACSTCHVGGYASMNTTFAKPYPHFVAMPASQGGAKQVSAAEMVQFCMLAPMQAEPFAWDSGELAALTAYVQHIQPGYKAMANPCAGKNPCNPCGHKNACNPCGHKNPCGH